MADYTRYAALTVAKHGGVATVTLAPPDHPHASDALITGAMHTELTKVFVDIRNDDAVRVVVLTGRGNRFGQPDLGLLLDTQESDWLRIMREARRIITDLLAIPQPIVCAMNGDATGLGWSIASFTDFIVAVEGSTVSDLHIALGLAPGDGSALAAPWQMPLNKAKQVYMLGEAISVEDLHRMGVIAHVVPRDDLSTATAALVDRLLAQPADALQWTKAILNKPLQMTAQIGLDQALAAEGWGWHLQSVQSAIETLRNQASVGGDA